MLEIKDLHAKIGDKEILKGINLTIKDGETHAIMGPNGSGKSTLSAVLVGNPLYEVTSGSITFNGKDLLEMKPEDRAHEGLFLSFQYPVEIPGVSMTNFMRAAINEKRKYEGKEPLNAADFLKLMREKRKIVELDSKLSNRSVNEGFSGGEKKRNEISRWQCSSRSSVSWTRLTLASTLTPCALLPKASTSCAHRSRAASLSLTMSACSTSSSPTSFTCSTRDAS